MFLRIVPSLRWFSSSLSRSSARLVAAWAESRPSEWVEGGASKDAAISKPASKRRVRVRVCLRGSQGWPFLRFASACVAWAHSSGMRVFAAGAAPGRIPRVPIPLILISSLARFPGDSIALLRSASLEVTRRAIVVRPLDVQEAPQTKTRPGRPDQRAYSQEHDGQLHQRDGVEGHRQEYQVLPNALDHEVGSQLHHGQSGGGTDRAHHYALNDEGPANEPVGRPHELHDLDFFAAGIDREPDGVRDQQDRHPTEHHKKDHQDVADDRGHLEDAFRYLLPVADFVDVLTPLKPRGDVPDLFRVVQGDFEGSGQGIPAQVFDHIGAFAHVLFEALQGFVLAHELRFFDLFPADDLRLQALDLLCGHRVFKEDTDLHLLLDVLEHRLDVVDKDHDRTEYGHAQEDSHQRGNGHEVIASQGAQRLPQEELKLPHIHPSAGLGRSARRPGRSPGGAWHPPFPYRESP